MVSYEVTVFRVLHNADKTLLMDRNYPVCLVEEHRMAGRQLIGNAVLASGTEVRLVPATVLSENVCIFGKKHLENWKGKKELEACVWLILF